MAADSTVPAHWLRGDSPNWNEIDRRVACSRCDYDLRGLSKPRCPECGLSFEWREALAALLTTSPWLFEHQWAAAPLRSLWQTFYASCRPRRFWNAVSIHWPVDSIGLWLQLGAALLLPNLFRIATLQAAWGATRLWAWVDLASVGTYGAPPASELFWDLSTDSSAVAVVLNLTAGAGLFSLVHIAVLCSLRQSLARCRVRPAQMLRVAACAALPFWCLTGASLFITRTTFALISEFQSEAPPMLSPMLRWFDKHDEFFTLLPLMIVAVFGFRHLTVGLSQYLGLPRAGLVIVLTSILAALVLLVAFELATGNVSYYGVVRTRCY